jgi:hypothetical protein
MAQLLNYTEEVQLTKADIKEAIKDWLEANLPQGARLTRTSIRLPQVKGTATVIYAGPPPGPVPPPL